MKIIIHRGTHQIGGCATEVTTEKTRIIIDFGNELPDENGNVPDNPLIVDGVNTGAPHCDAVFFTHYHGDHIGAISKIDQGIPLYMGKVAKDIHLSLCQYMHSEDTPAVERIIPFKALEPVYIGDMKITPIPSDHSSYDSYMFLIEAEGKRIIHTGDFRMHGFRRKSLRKLLRKYGKNVDLVITEGTLLSRQAISEISEFDLQNEIRKIVAENKYVFVLCSSTNIDRLASFYNATPKGKYFICDKMQSELLRTVALSSSSRYYQFAKALTYGENLSLRERGFVMVVRCNDYFREIMNEFVSEGLLIYSMWDGYLDGRSPEINRFVESFKENQRMEYKHTSGHCSPQGIIDLVNMVKPKKVIPIHTEEPQKLKKLLVGVELLLPSDRETIEV